MSDCTEIGFEEGVTTRAHIFLSFSMFMKINFKISKHAKDFVCVSKLIRFSQLVQLKY